MTASTKLPGINGLIYVGVAGTTPTVVLADEQDVTLEIDNKAITWATRGQPREDTAYGTQALSGSTNIVKDNSNASFGILQAASMSRAYVAMKFLDKASGKGWDGDWMIEKYSEKQGTDGVIMVAISFKQSLALRDVTVI